MSSKEITLITTALSKFTKEKKNLVYLGVWCHPEEWNNFNSLKKKQIIKEQKARALASKYGEVSGADKD